MANSYFLLFQSLSYSLTHLHELQSSVGDGVEMGWSFISPFVSVVVSHDLSVDHQPFVRIDANAEQTRICIDLEHGVSARTKGYG